MKTILLLLSFWSLTCTAQITVISDTSVNGNSSTKFVFERLNKSSTKKIKGGKGIMIRLSIGDTSVRAYGWLVDADNETITINPLWKVNNVKKDNHNFTESFDYNNSLMTFDIDSVKSIEYDHNFMAVPSGIGFASLGSALIVSPLISIDKNSQHNFNVPRYKTVVLSSLASAVFFLTVTIISENRKNAYRLKPKLIKKI